MIQNRALGLWIWNRLVRSKADFMYIMCGTVCKEVGDSGLKAHYPYKKSRSD